MPLREADAYNYVKFKSTLAESDCNAIYETGPNAYTIRPVLIRDGGTELFVELDNYSFRHPETLPNFVRYELTAQERDRREAEKATADAAAAARAQKLPGRNWEETRAAAAARNAQALTASRNYTGATQADIAAGQKQYEAEVTERESARQKHTRSRI
jgi:hypothetical protein